MLCIVLGDIHPKKQQDDDGRGWGSVTAWEKCGLRKLLSSNSFRMMSSCRNFKTKHKAFKLTQHTCKQLVFCTWGKVWVGVEVVEMLRLHCRRQRAGVVSHHLCSLLASGDLSRSHDRLGKGKMSMTKYLWKSVRHCLTYLCCATSCQRSGTVEQGCYVTTKKCPHATLWWRQNFALFNVTLL